MQPYERSELGEVGEGFCLADSAIPLTAATTKGEGECEDCP
jgi:hypothetical protein